MKKMKKVLALGLSAVMVMSLAVGCGSKDKTTQSSSTTTETNQESNEQDNNNQESSNQESSNQPVTLTTVTMMGGTDPNTTKYQEVMKQFMADHPNVTIEDNSEVANQDWKQKIAADFSVGNEPDVIQYFTDANASEVLAANKFVTVDEIRAKYPDYAKDTLPASLIAASAPDGTSYAVPTTGYWEGLFCNKDLFEKYKVDLPTDWDSFIKAIKTFKENNIIPIAISLNEMPHYMIEILMMKSAGPEEFTKIPTEAPDSWVNGLKLLKELKDMGAFPKDTDTISNELASNYFKNKEAAMQVEGSWFSGGIPDQDNTVVIQFPVVPNGKAAQTDMIGGLSSGFYITKKAWDDPAKQKIAVEFVMANTNKEQVTNYWAGNGAAAVAVEPPADMKPLGLSGIELSSNSTFYPPTDARLSQESFSTFVAGIVPMTNGDKDPKELLNEALAIHNK